MNPLQPLRIQQASGIADDQSAIHVRPRHRIPPAVRNRLRAISNQLATFDNFLYVRVRLELLKSFVRIELRIVVFERDDHAERNAVLLQTVDPAAPVHARIERPTERMADKTGFDPSRRRFPQFLDSNSVSLRV